MYKRSMSIVLAGGLLLVGCAADAPPNVQSGYHYYEGSQEKAGSSGMQAQIRGQFALVDTCWTLGTEFGSSFLALPEGTVTFQQDDGTLTVQMPGGTQLSDGQELDLAGGHVTAQLDDDAQLAALVAECPSVLPGGEATDGQWEIATPNGYR